MDKQQMTRTILEAKKAQKMRWSEIAAEIGMSPVWTASLALGESSAPQDIAEKLCAVLDLDDEVAEALQVCPLKGEWMTHTVPRDPLIYRFYEIMAVYGPAVKACVHEEFGDGIMSAIDFKLDIEREPDPKGDRVKVIMSGKFLPYVRW
ncbi:cyanase [Salinisphaera sp. T31B1]|uniref:cyanase n=1 Tax=Salinisphaera sp. T31B1 TaxID=727963 RepID=UPI00333EE655